MRQSSQLPIALRQSLSQAIQSVISAPTRIAKLTPGEQAFSLKQLALLEALTHSAIRQLVRRE